MLVEALKRSRIVGAPRACGKTFALCNFILEEEIDSDDTSFVVVAPNQRRVGSIYREWLSNFSQRGLVPIFMPYRSDGVAGFRRVYIDDYFELPDKAREELRALECYGIGTPLPSFYEAPKSSKTLDSKPLDLRRFVPRLSGYLAAAGIPSVQSVIDEIVVLATARLQDTIRKYGELPSDALILQVMAAEAAVMSERRGRPGSGMAEDMRRKSVEQLEEYFQSLNRRDFKRKISPGLYDPLTGEPVRTATRTKAELTTRAAKPKADERPIELNPERKIDFGNDA